MKNQNRHVSVTKLVALLMSALLMLGMLPTSWAFAAQTGSLTVKLKEDTYANLPTDPAVQVTLYQVGVAAPETRAGWRIDSAFTGYKILDAETSGDLKVIAEKIAGDIVGKSEFAGTVKQLSGGTARFTGLEMGVYLGVLTGGPEGLKVDPFIVTVPSTDPETKQIRLDYDVTLKDECLTEATVRKVWLDNENQDGIRPKTLKVALMNGAASVATVTLSENNNWEGFVGNLPRYSNHEPIEYIWQEESLPEGYTLTGTSTEGTVTTLTNAHTPQVTSATVRKVWNDNDNQDGIRPANLTVTLSDGQSVTLNEANGWQATIDNLPKYDDGVEIAYTWSEGDMPEGYTLAGTATEGIVTTLTNAHTPQVTSATVRKVWNDNDNQDGIRPESLTVTLSNGQSVVLSEANGWQATIDNLPMYANGQQIAYTWTENNLPEGYALTDTVVEGTVTTLTNTHAPETVSLTVRKIWNDNENQDGVRPGSLTVTLSDGQSVTLNRGNNWEATIENLPKYANGQEISYRWTESALPEGYTLTGNSTDGTVTTLTNTHVTATIDISGQKIWDDENNAHLMRPDTITVQLYADGTLVNATPTWRGNRTSTWTYTFSGLPALTSGGKEITYTVREVPVPGYESNVSGFTITNKLPPRTPKEYKEITGVKTWVDDDNAGGKRPSFITVHLLRNGVEVATRTVTAETGWNYSFGMQPVDDGYGNLYHYEVREDGIPGYFCRVDGVNLINTALPNTPGNPNVPTDSDSEYTPTGRRVQTRKTATPPPEFDKYGEEELEEMTDIFDYGTPLWGGLLGTGDETPIYPYIFAGVGVVAVVALLVFGRKRKKKVK